LIFPSSSYTLAAEIQMSGFLGLDCIADFKSNLALGTSPRMSLPILDVLS
jgi:hypothetical protein